MTPSFHSVSARAVLLLGALLGTALAQTSAPDSLRSRLGLPEPAQPAQTYQKPPLTRVTLLDLSMDGWKLPEGSAFLAAAPLKMGSVTTLTGAQVARLGLTEVSIQGVYVSRDLRWTRVELRLHNLGAARVALGGLTWWASGEQGSELATLPGLYDQRGAVIGSLAAGETRPLAIWIQLPTEGPSDTAMRGSELATTLLIGSGSRTLRLNLPRLR
ncbi:hypothetical protein MF271_05315 [Deinococcus sp. KNUC1210]|uniref:hypothetical protein n=1 Tax=Deinococcus sp. KNUC1210 TaxID=2917691 RepID=UPI001EF1528B|nr:hypothetical protein [Deinococcus sp. KNUC1210]ULH16053.1 hypothetical protein MF271_05315 [Deinococcus sp. KNUC1210]